MDWKPIVVLLLVIAVVTSVMAWRQSNKILDRFLARFAEPEPEPVVSTLPVPDPDGWSSEVGWNPWVEWDHCRSLAADEERWAQAMDARRSASERAWAVRILRDADSSPILAELMAAGPAAIEPAPTRELTGATS